MPTLSRIGAGIWPLINYRRETKISYMCREHYQGLIALWVDPRNRLASLEHPEHGGTPTRRRRIAASSSRCHLHAGHTFNDRDRWLNNFVLLVWAAHHVPQPACPLRWTPNSWSARGSREWRHGLQVWLRVLIQAVLNQRIRRHFQILTRPRHVSTSAPRMRTVQAAPERASVGGGRTQARHVDLYSSENSQPKEEREKQKKQKTKTKHSRTLPQTLRKRNSC